MRQRFQHDAFQHNHKRKNGENLLFDFLSVNVGRPPNTPICSMKKEDAGTLLHPQHTHTLKMTKNRGKPSAQSPRKAGPLLAKL